MRAITFSEPGGPDVLRVTELPEPHAGPGEVRIRVHAATVNPTDELLRMPAYFAMLKDQLAPHICGMDAAGVIDELGLDADARLSLGQRVVAVVLPTSPRKGAYAELIVVPAASVVAMPAGADFAAASTLLMNSLTARLGIDSLGLRAGQTLAVTGAAGALGLYVLELARADGLRVIADAKESDRETVRARGATDVVERGPDFAANVRRVAPEGADALFDCALQHAEVVEAIRDGGGMVTVRGWKEPVPRGIRVLPVFVSTGALETAKLDALRQQAEAGVLGLRVADIYPASEAGTAQARLAAGGVRGRLVLDFTRWT